MPFGEITATASFVGPVSPLPDAMMPGASVATVLAVGVIAVAADRGELEIDQGYAGTRYGFAAVVDYRRDRDLLLRRDECERISRRCRARAQEQGSQQRSHHESPASSWRGTIARSPLAVTHTRTFGRVLLMTAFGEIEPAERA